MEKTVEIVATHAIDSMMDASFVLNNKRRVLISEFGYIDRDLHDETKFQEVTLPFTGKQSRKVIKYKISDETGEPLTTVDKNIENTIKNFYMLHPLTLINGKPHTNTVNGAVVYYDIVDINQKTISELKRFHNKRAVMNSLSEKNLAEIRDVCFMYGVAPKGKTKGALILELAEYNTGFLFKVEKGSDKSEHYIATFINNQDPDKVTTINARKAIDYGIVRLMVNEAGQNYYLGNELIGGTFEDVVVFCKQNTEMYNSFILKGIKERDRFDGEEASSELEKVSLRDNDASDPMVVEVFRKQVQELQEKVAGLVGKDAVCMKKNQITTAGYGKLQDAFDKLVKQEKEFLAEKV